MYLAMVRVADPNGSPGVFAAIADPTRREMLGLLAAGELPVKDIQRPFAMTQPAISQHLRVLERAGLVSQRKQGRLRMYRLEAARLKDVYDWLAHYRRFWEGKLTALGDYLDQSTSAQEP